MACRPWWKHEARACRLLNRYFDLLLVHADPTFQRLEASFGQTAALTTPLIYTGYVAQGEVEVDGESAPSSSEAEIVLTAQPLILASIGGGRVGSELLQATVAASITLAARFTHQLLIFTGPYIPAAEFAALAAMVPNYPHITLRRYTNRFLHYMRKADLSLSMTGYNTCMNILATGVRALVLPFTGGDNDEQGMRAAKLAELGIVGLLDPAALTADQLAARIVTQLQSPLAPTSIDLAGVAHSAKALRELSLPTQSHQRPYPAGTQRAEIPGAQLLAKQLRPFLDQWGEAADRTAQPVHLFLRDDDIDEDEETLRELLDVALARGVPLNLEVIPGNLAPGDHRLLFQIKGRHGMDDGWAQQILTVTGANPTPTPLPPTAIPTEPPPPTSAPPTAEPPTAAPPTPEPPTAELPTAEPPTQAPTVADVVSVATVPPTALPAVIVSDSLSPSVAITQPPRWDEEQQTLWQGAVPGTPITPQLLSPAGPALAERLGRAAASLTRSSLQPSQRSDAKKQQKRSTQYADRVRTFFPALAPTLDDLLARLTAIHAANATQRLRPIHGAPHPHQWLADGDQLGLVDFDGFAWGEPELDVATFLAEMDFEDSAQVPVAAINAAFQAGYEAVAGPLNLQLRNAYRAHKRLSKALRNAYAMRSDNDLRVARALEQALVAVG